MAEHRAVYEIVLFFHSELEEQSWKEIQLSWTLNYPLHYKALRNCQHTFPGECHVPDFSSQVLASKSDFLLNFLSSLLALLQTRTCPGKPEADHIRGEPSQPEVSTPLDPSWSLHSWESSQAHPFL